MMKRNARLGIIIGGIILILMIALAVVGTQSNQGEESFFENPFGRERQSAEIGTFNPDDVVTRSNDIELLQALTIDGPIDTERFTLHYNTAQNVFLADLYGQDRVEEIENLHSDLKSRGIQQPENIEIIYNGPHGYEDAVLIPDEFIEQVEDKYEN